MSKKEKSNKATEPKKEPTPKTGISIKPGAAATAKPGISIKPK